MINRLEIEFEKPYYLRAQNSGNRSGYGLEWWGRDTCFEGKEYDETDDYCFSGVKIEIVQSLGDAKKRRGNLGIKEYPQYDSIVPFSEKRF